MAEVETRKMPAYKPLRDRDWVDSENYDKQNFEKGLRYVKAMLKNINQDEVPF